jgi:type VI secretion system protein ImpI
MQLLLTLVNAEKFGLSDAVKRVGGGSALSIGRGKQAGWTLPDPTRLLSAVHCEIKHEKGRFTLTDFSRNGTQLNGAALVRLEPASLTEGDEIGIGPYLIRAGKAAAAEPDQKTVVVRNKVPESGSPAFLGDKTVIGGGKSAETEWAVDPALSRQLGKPQAAPAKRPAPGRSASAQPGLRRFVDAFCEGAGLDPDALAGRADAEFAQDLGALMRKLVTGMQDLSHSVSELRAVIGSAERHGQGDPGSGADLNAAAKRRETERLLIAHFGGTDTGESGEALAAALDDAARNNRAAFHAMQAALFRLLNDISPTAIERETKTGLIRSRPARNWSAYLNKWDELNGGGEDGMLDVFIHYFGEAYDARLRDF